MFKLVSLNLNGIRSATSKGLEAWLDQTRPDCIGVQEVKAQAGDVAGRFEELSGLRGHFHFAEKKGYSGVGLYTRHEPSDVRIGYGSPEFDAEGRYVELRFDTPQRKVSLISCYFPSGSSGDERQQAKFRFLDQIYPHLQQLRQEREFIVTGDVNIAHKEMDLKNWKGNLKNSGLPLTLGNVIAGTLDVPAGCFIDDDELQRWARLKGSKRIPRVAKTGYEYNFTEGAMPFPDRLDRAARTIITSELGGGASRTRHVVRHNDGRLRRLTAEELEAAFQFPRGYTGGLTNAQSSLLLGNAVMPGVIERIARVIAS